ncbi:MAG: aldo/keto reductase [Acidimicrobiales bacterium]|nr:aldo/keto reductase [Acidimicrobiales bacterium]
MAPRGLVLGTVQLGTEYGIANRTGRPAPQDAIDLLQSAARGGVAALDTAPGYGDAEELIGSAGVALPVCTKIAAGAEPARSLEGSLRRLRRDSVEVLFLHDPEVLEGDGDGVIDRAAVLVGERVGLLGASVYTPAQFAAALSDDRIGAIQAPASAADQRLVRDGLLERAAAEGKPVYLRSVFLQGALLLAPGELPPHLTGLQPVVERVGALARERHEPMGHVLVAFARDLPGVAGVVVGAESADQVDQNLRAFAAPSLTTTQRDAVMALPSADEGVVDPRRWVATR